MIGADVFAFVAALVRFIFLSVEDQVFKLPDVCFDQSAGETTNPAMPKVSSARCRTVRQLSIMSVWSRLKQPKT